MRNSYEYSIQRFSYRGITQGSLMCGWKSVRAPDRGGRRAEGRARSQRRGTSPPDSGENASTQVVEVH